MIADKKIMMKVDGITIDRAGKSILQDISFVLCKGDHLAITGLSGSGKTNLALALAGKVFYKGEIHFPPAINHNIVWIEQQHHFKNLSNTNDLYYQQRFNSYDSEKTKTVEESLLENGDDIEEVLRILKIEDLKNKPLIQLSNGENKKLQIAKALLLQPSILIMDQPFIGLDTETREYLHSFFNKLAEQDILIVLTTSPDEIPGCISKVLSLDKGKIKTLETRKDFIKNHSLRESMSRHSGISRIELKKNSSFNPAGDFKYAIKMMNVNVQYGEKKILQHISWEVKKGERWLLSGPNGAGKSTLLSLVTADNPQAYANDFFLFDKKRGSGESIWDIKKKIGYLSSELHLFFDQSCTCFETIASGLFDTIGLFRQLSAEDNRLVTEWIEIAGIKELQYTRLFELSTGEQRIILLIRALVKNPTLLILDEPCQGVDDHKQEELLKMIDSACLEGNKTMVFVTHYLNKKPACIDHFLKLDKGNIIETGVFVQ